MLITILSIALMDHLFTYMKIKRGEQRERVLEAIRKMIQSDLWVISQLKYTSLLLCMYILSGLTIEYIIIELLFYMPLCNFDYEGHCTMPMGRKYAQLAIVFYTFQFCVAIFHEELILLVSRSLAIPRTPVTIAVHYLLGSTSVVTIVFILFTIGVTGIMSCVLLIHLVFLIMVFFRYKTLRVLDEDANMWRNQ